MRIRNLLTGNHQTPLEHSLRRSVGWFIKHSSTRNHSCNNNKMGEKKKILLLAYWEETVISRIALKLNCWADQKCCSVYGKT